MITDILEIRLYVSILFVLKNKSRLLKFIQQAYFYRDSIWTNIDGINVGKYSNDPRYSPLLINAEYRSLLVMIKSKV